MKAGEPHVLLDVRERVQFDICSLPNSLNIPLRFAARGVIEARQFLYSRELKERLSELVLAVDRGADRDKRDAGDAKDSSGLSMRDAVC